MNIIVGNSLDVSQVALVARGWLDCLDRQGADVVVDAGALARIDTAGIQLLLSLEREAVARHGSFRIGSASPLLKSTLSLLGLSLPSAGGPS